MRQAQGFLAQDPAQALADVSALVWQDAAGLTDYGSAGNDGLEDDVNRHGPISKVELIRTWLSATVAANESSIQQTA